MNRKPIFDAVRAMLGRGFTEGEVAKLDSAIDAAEGKTVRRIGAKGLALIKEFEGCKLTAYTDPIGIWTVGYGSTGPHVKPGMTLTEAEAEALLVQDLARFEAAVANLAPIATQNQYDALVSLAFNVGEGALKSSTLLKLHNAGDYIGAADQFKRWNRAGGRVLAGLTRRRAAEAELYRAGS